MPGLSFISSGFLLILSSILFSLSHPGFLNHDGIPVFAWMYFIPALMLIRLSSLRRSALYGFFYGIISNALFAYWLFTYSLPSMVAVLLVYGLLQAILFLILSYTEKRCPNFSGLLIPLILCFYEYIRSRGIFGFSYGNPVYSQYQNPLFLHASSVFSIWPLTFLLYAVNSFVSSLLLDFLSKKVKVRPLALRGSLLLGGLTLLFLIGEQDFSRRKGEETVSYPVILIQNNASPWQEGIEQYKKEVEGLKRLTDEALSEHPQAKLVVWSETAVVCDILYHYNHRTDYERTELVRNLLTYIDSKKCDFIIGNNMSVSRDGVVRRYNSALCFTPGKNVLPPHPQTYAKRHLVPLTEYLPRPLGFLSVVTEELDGLDWSKGEGGQAFDLDGIKIVTPICFEDTFDYEVSSLVKKNDADLIVTLSNDSWAHSRACQNQHLSMAVFRSAENHIPSVRSSVSGETCAIDASGKIIARLEAMREGFLFCELPLPKDSLCDEGEKVKNTKDWNKNKK